MVVPPASNTFASLAHFQKLAPNAYAFFLQIAGHTSVYINEPRLSDFKQVLNKAGIQAEFAGGVLICNNVVAVRRVSKVCWKLLVTCNEEK